MGPLKEEKTYFPLPFKVYNFSYGFEWTGLHVCLSSDGRFEHNVTGSVVWKEGLRAFSVKVLSSSLCSFHERSEVLWWHSVRPFKSSE